MSIKSRLGGLRENLPYREGLDMIRASSARAPGKSSQIVGGAEAFVSWDTCYWHLHARWAGMQCWGIRTFLYNSLCAEGPVFIP